jgi:hypothetical protein
MTNRVLYSALAVLVLGAACRGDEPRQTAKCSVEAAAVRLRDQFGYSFTVERREQKAGPLADLSDPSITEPTDLTNADDAIKYLRAQLSNVVVEVDAKNPKIIHLIDDKLVKDDNYALAATASLKYHGTPSGLVEDLGKLTNGRIGTPQMVSIGESSGDYVTPIIVDADNLSLRSVLSDFIPPQAYHPIFWVADFRENTGGGLVFVRYNGPVAPAPASAGKAGEKTGG